MTMIKGYSIPSPGAGDGEYGSFAGYAASPTTRPYWEGQGIANTMPALNGYAEVPPMPSTNGMIALAAIAGYLFRGVKGAALAGGAAYYLTKPKTPSLGGYGMTDRQENRPGRPAGKYPGPVTANWDAGHGGSTKLHGFNFGDGTTLSTTPSDAELAAAGPKSNAPYVIAALLGIKFLWF